LRVERGEGGDGGGGGGVVVGAVLEGGVDAGVDRDVVGAVAPWGVGADEGGEGGVAGFFDAEEIGRAGELGVEFFGLAFVERAEARRRRGDLRFQI